ncbi:hypothetical protein EYC84_005183 [Monilinia fructicola]|uniref:HOOK N-terminal domain-containing protein n=1 Tax=Monilinia fructicola TaxID=38448 RepID=A0A5M9JY79_MONFR|nr:hypothetical protein EYC84_005183 [Monilinia fructicola]
MPTSLELPNDSQRAALLAWINTFPAVLSKVTTIEDLTDGLVLSDMLEDFDPAYAVKDLPQATSSTKWVAAKQCLEAVYKSLIKFVHQNCGPWMNAAIVEYPINFNALAQYSDPNETMKLITIFLLVALKGPIPVRYIERIKTKLSYSTQTIIANYLETIENDLEATVPNVKSDRLLKPSEELDLEAKYSIVLTEVGDKFKELEVENSALLKRANKVDHYEKKLAQQNAIERENTRLREQLDVLQENQKDYDKVHMENELLKTTRSEYMKVLEGQENTITDLKNKIMRLEEEIRLRADEMELALERQRHDEKYINELQERANSQSPAEPSGGFSLEDELNRSDSPQEPSPQLEISRLRAELQVLKSNDGGKANAELRSELQKSGNGSPETS